MLSFLLRQRLRFAFENKNVQDIIQYFEKTWINGVYKPNYIGRKTNNDLALKWLSKKISKITWMLQF